MTTATKTLSKEERRARREKRKKKVDDQTPEERFHPAKKHAMKDDKEQMARYSTLFIRDIPADLKAQYKGLCARRDVSLREAIMDHMRDALNKDGKLHLDIRPPKEEE